MAQCCVALALPWVTYVLVLTRRGLRTLLALLAFSDKLFGQRAKRHNAVTPFPVIDSKRAKCDFACASDYNLPPSLREVSRQSRDGGSSCPPCVREGGAAKLRRKGCLAIIRCKRRHCVMPFLFGGTKVVCRLGHEIAAEMANS